MKYILKTLSISLLIFLFACQERFTLETNQIPYTNESIKKLYIQTKEEILNSYDALDKLTIEQYIQQNVNGKWNDINYSDNRMSIWEPYNHLHRTLLIAIAYNKLKKFNNSHTINIINDALSDYRINKYTSKNWWYNSIGSCSIIGKILLLMNGFIDKENWSYFTSYLNNLSPQEHLGANKIDIATYHYYRGICTSNDSIIQSNVNIIYDVLDYNDNDGFQIDGSYIHNNIRYISGYGETVIEGIINMLSYTNDTEYCINKSRLKILSDFLIGTYGNVLRGAYMDWNAIGRQISRPNYLNKKNYINIFKKMETIDSDNSNMYKSIITNMNNVDPNNINLTKYFFKSDYLLHCNKYFNFSVGGTSIRLSKPERANGENLLGSLLSLGSTSFRIKGDEYYNIFPFWEWSMIPGVTSTKTIPVFEKDGGVSGKSFFSGGISIEQDNLGIYSFILNDYDLKGKKSYFCIPEGIICLGNELTGNKELHTTINQCYYNQLDFCIGFDKKEVIHNGINYTILDDNEFIIDLSEVKGNWNFISKEQQDSILYSEIFKLYISHNKNDYYAYAITPQVLKFDVRNIIFWNDSNKQGLFMPQTNKLLMTFFSPDSIDFKDINLKVDKPCSLIVDYNNKLLYISDPIHTEKYIQITYNNKSYNLNFPTGEYIGASICYKL